MCVDLFAVRGGRFRRLRVEIRQLQWGMAFLPMAEPLEVPQRVGAAGDLLIGMLTDDHQKALGLPGRRVDQENEEEHIIGDPDREVPDVLFDHQQDAGRARRTRTPPQA